MIAGAQLAWHVLEGEDPKEFLRRVLKQSGHKKNMLSVGEEVISGTGDTRDIMEACLNALKALDRDRFAAELSDHDVFQYTTLGEIHNDFDPEYYLFERLFSILQKYCPLFSYFGHLEADGSVGCWPLDNMALEDMEEGKVTLVDERENPQQANAIRRGDFGGIPSPYAIIDKAQGGKELWNTQTFVKIWDW